jgi:uncharacterized protein YkwD
LLIGVALKIFMNFVDIALIIIVILAIWGGWRKGFVIGSFELISWIGTLVIGFLGYKYVAALMERFFSLGVWTLPAAFILTLIFARILFSIIINNVLKITPTETHYSVTNKLLGVFPGFVNGAIYATLIAGLLMAFPISDKLSEESRQSAIASELAVQVEWFDDKISPIFDQAVSQSMNKLTIKPDSDKSVNLPFSVSAPRVRADLEAQMLALVNDERKKQNLPPLKADPELTIVARAHSKDMFGRGYFAHKTPDGLDPFDRMRKAHVRFSVAGENLALGQTLTICHNGLMNSPGHRANILDASYGRVGIGILHGGMHGLMVTQNFRN